ncbi:nuclear transport factor 2 [Armillaria solidipes]|uniref:Nuclear transport factor 2 n=1 Tax=Armillaria solidipes TaxID=1076256 RepID=A0A2H3B0U2_9AGAR|nr:nuclear transport factor 2 [Armillaria solidipes]
MADLATVAKQFTDFYYNTFDSNRPALASLYRPESMLTWENNQILGVSNIVEKLVSLPFEKVLHKVETCDAQPSNPAAGSIIVLVTGLLRVDDGEQPLPFTQTFQLIPDAGTYYVYNDLFRLNLGG